MAEKTAKELTQDTQKNQIVFMDPLEALLNVDVTKRPSMDVNVNRPGGAAFKVSVEGIDQDNYDALVEECSTYSIDKKTRARMRHLDSKQLQRLLILRSTKNPNLKDPKLLQKYGISDQMPELIVTKVFLPGEIDRISDAIMECSGFTDDLVDTAKNS